MKVIRQVNSSKENHPKALQLLQLKKKGRSCTWKGTNMALGSLLGQAVWVYRGNPELLALKANSNYINKFSSLKDESRDHPVNFLAVMERKGNSP